MADKEYKIARVKRRMAKQKERTDKTDKCHICDIHTDGECDFDKDMNPYSDPSPCCGCHSCAEDT
jgi:hypothetical protein